MNGYEAYQYLCEAKTVNAKFERDPETNRIKLKSAAVGGLGGAVAGGIAGGYINGTKEIYKGWHAEKKAKENGATDEELKELRKDVYKKAAKAALKGAGSGAAIGAGVGGGGAYTYASGAAAMKERRDKANAEKAIRNKYGNDTEIKWK